MLGWFTRKEVGLPPSSFLPSFLEPASVARNFVTVAGAIQTRSAANILLTFSVGTNTR
jgi:hypothetical protein